MSLQSEVLTSRLRSINATQQSIESTSSWALFFASDLSNVTLIVGAWVEEVTRAPNDKKLALLYLSNHILQEGKRKGRLFGEEFSKVMGKAVREVLRTADSKTRNSVARVVRVWEERRVFGSTVVKNLKEQLARAEASAGRGGGSRNGGGGVDEAARRKLQATGPLAQMLAEAFMAAQKSEEHTMKALQLQPQILEVGTIDDVGAAQTVLSDCLTVLEAEVQVRQRTAAELREQVSKQEDGMRQAQQRMQQFEQHKALADARMATLKQQQQQQQPLPNGMPGPSGGGRMGQPPPPHLAHLMALQGMSGPVPPSLLGSMGLPPGMPSSLSLSMGPPGMPFTSLPPLNSPEAMLMAMQHQQSGSVPPLPPHAFAMLAASGAMPSPHLPVPPSSAPGQSHPHPQPPHHPMHSPQQSLHLPGHSAPMQPPRQHPHPPGAPSQQQPPSAPRQGTAAPPPPPISKPSEQQQPSQEAPSDQDAAAMFAKAFAAMPEEERQRLAAGMAAAAADLGGAPSASTSLGPPPPPPPQLGENGGNGEDSLLADADFSRYILGEDPMGGQGYSPSSGVEGDGLDDYNPEDPF